MYQVAVIFIHATVNSFSQLVHNDCKNISEMPSIWEWGYWLGFWWMLPVRVWTKCRAMVLCGWWLSSCWNEKRLEGCPGPAWYLNFWVSIESPLHLFLLFPQESNWGKYQTYVSCTFYFMGIFFVCQTRWSFNLKFYGHSHFTKCDSYLSWLRFLLYSMCSQVADAGNQLL